MRLRFLGFSALLCVFSHSPAWARSCSDLLNALEAEIHKRPGAQTMLGLIDPSDLTVEIELVTLSRGRSLGAFRTMDTQLVQRIELLKSNGKPFGVGTIRDEVVSQVEVFRETWILVDGLTIKGQKYRDHPELDVFIFDIRGKYLGRATKLRKYTSPLEVLVRDEKSNVYFGRFRPDGQPQLYSFYQIKDGILRRFDVQLPKEIAETEPSDSPFIEGEKIGVRMGKREFLVDLKAFQRSPPLVPDSTEDIQ